MPEPSRVPSRPDLEAILDVARAHTVTAEELAAQRRSWVIGELMLDDPAMSRAEAEALVDSVEQMSNTGAPS